MTRLCSIEGCEGQIVSRKTGFCSIHHARFIKHGDPLGGGPRRFRREGCLVDGCSSQHQSMGYCGKHYQRLLKYGDPTIRLTPEYEMGKLDWIRLHSEYEGADCLFWPYKANTHGRGMVTFPGGECMMANRYMCEVAHGAPPTPDHEAAHSCGNGHLGCLSPKHLRWATHAENMAEMVDHGTSPKGERNGHAKLTEDDVREIKRLRGHVTQRELAKRFGVGHANIAQIQRGFSWKHVEV